MIPLPEFKKLLGTTATDLPAADIERLRDLEDRLADIIFDAWLRKRNQHPDVADKSEI